MAQGLIAVWFSSGVASAVALQETIKQYGKDAVRAVNQPILEEHPDNKRFLDDVSTWLDIEIEENRSSKFPLQSAREVWQSRKYMSGVAGAPCTTILKKQARQEWENENKPDYHVLGFTIEEKARADRFRMTERQNLLTPLIDRQITKWQCFDIIRLAGIKPPMIYELGFPNANCVGCVKSQSPTYWNLVRSKFPDVFEDRAKQSRELGVKLVVVKGKRIFLDALEPDQKGGNLNTMPDCGLFCEEY